jgi:hypothetical protein
MILKISYLLFVDVVAVVAATVVVFVVKEHYSMY